MRINNVRKSKNGKALTFDIHDVDVSIVNALRRIVLAEIPNVAFMVDLHGGESDVKININRSSLHNEFLLHRISLIPLCFEESEVESFSPDKYTFELKVKNTGTDPLDVTTRDFRIYDADGKLMPESFREKVFPKNEVTNDYILITRLRPNLQYPDKGDELDIRATASVDCAKKNACWSPVSVCMYHNIVDEEAAKKGLAEFMSSRPGMADADERFKALERYRYFVKNEYGEPNGFEFTIESECRLRPEYIFEKAIDVLIAKARKLADDIEAVRATKLPNGMTTFNFDGEDHTLGNVLQAMAYNNYVRDANRAAYVGYYLPHPLEDRIVVKIKMRDGSDGKEVIGDTCKDVVDYLASLKNTWLKA